MKCQCGVFASITVCMLYSFKRQENLFKEPVKQAKKTYIKFNVSQIVSVLYASMHLNLLKFDSLEY